MCSEQESWRDLGGPFPQFDGAFWEMESDAREKVLSGPRAPRFGDDAAWFERSRFIVRVVDNEIEKFRWKGARHRGLHHDLGALIHRRSYFSRLRLVESPVLPHDSQSLTG